MWIPRIQNVRCGIDVIAFYEFTYKINRWLIVTLFCYSYCNLNGSIWRMKNNKNSHKKPFASDTVFSAKFYVQCVDRFSCCRIYVDTVIYCDWQWNSALCVTITTTFRSEITLSNNTARTQIQTNSMCYWKYTTKLMLEVQIYLARDRCLCTMERRYFFAHQWGTWINNDTVHPKYTQDLRYHSRFYFLRAVNNETHEKWNTFSTHTHTLTLSLFLCVVLFIGLSVSPFFTHFFQPQIEQNT